MKTYFKESMHKVASSAETNFFDESNMLTIKAKIVSLAAGMQLKIKAQNPKVRSNDSPSISGFNLRKDVTRMKLKIWRTSKSRVPTVTWYSLVQFFSIERIVCVIIINKVDLTTSTKSCALP